jgi:DNA-binding MarR family transcriptional regulator
MAEVHRSYAALAELRYRIRKFLAFSERVAREAGLEPQHHQLMLAIKGLPEGVLPTMGALAERLQIQHHSCVELAARAETNGLIERTASKEDKRMRILVITRRGERLLQKLAEEHIVELSREAPALSEALRILVRTDGGEKKRDASSWKKKQQARAVRSRT